MKKLSIIVCVAMAVALANCNRGNARADENPYTEKENDKSVAVDLIIKTAQTLSALKLDLKDKLKEFLESSNLERTYLQIKDGNNLLYIFKSKHNDKDLFTCFKVHVNLSDTPTLTGFATGNNFEKEKNNCSTKLSLNIAKDLEKSFK